MTLSITLPEGWRDHITADERDITNRWSMWGWQSISKVGHKWDSGVPGAPLFRTKTEAHAYLTNFVTDMIPLRCLERMGI